MKRKTTSSASAPGSSQTRAIKKAKTTSRTTRSQAFPLYKGPFPPTRNVCFEYETGGYLTTAVLSTYLVQVSPNNLFDFDYGNNIGNKQPLYYDTLLTTNGPYKSYRVTKWEMKFTVVADVTKPLLVYGLPPTNAPAELDTLVEAEDFPGVTKRLISGSAGGGKTTITLKGRPEDVFGSHLDEGNLTAAFNAGPASPVYSGILVRPADASAAVSFGILVQAKIWADVFAIDAVAS